MQEGGGARSLLEDLSPKSQGSLSSPRGADGGDQPLNQVGTGQYPSRRMQPYSNLMSTGKQSGERSLELRPLEVTPHSGVVTQIVHAGPPSPKGTLCNERDVHPADSPENSNRPTINYGKNKRTSKVYREAYIGRSKQIRNLKSLAVLRKYQD